MEVKSESFCYQTNFLKILKQVQDFNFLSVFFSWGGGGEMGEGKAIFSIGGKIHPVDKGREEI